MITKSTLFRFVLIIGIVNLFADFTHEGGRSIIEPLLGALGASGAIVGFVGGFGEFMGHASVLFQGILQTRLVNSARRIMEEHAHMSVLEKMGCAGEVSIEAYNYE